MVWNYLLLLGTCLLSGGMRAPYDLGVQGGPLFFDGLSGTSAESLERTGGFSLAETDEPTEGEWPITGGSYSQDEMP